jgi:hypothetical protein
VYHYCNGARHIVRHHDRYSVTPCPLLTNTITVTLSAVTPVTHTHTHTRTVLGRHGEGTGSAVRRAVLQIGHTLSLDISLSLPVCRSHTFSRYLSLSAGLLVTHFLSISLSLCRSVGRTLSLDKSLSLPVCLPSFLIHTQTRTHTHTHTHRLSVARCWAPFSWPAPPSR